MIKQTLKQYLQKFTAYNKKHVVSTQFTSIENCTYKHTLIKKRTRDSNLNIPMGTSLLMNTFNRYMNNSQWKFYD